MERKENAYFNKDIVNMNVLTHQIEGTFFVLNISIAGLAYYNFQLSDWLSPKGILSK